MHTMNIVQCEHAINARIDFDQKNCVERLVSPSAHLTSPRPILPSLCKFGKCIERSDCVESNAQPHHTHTHTMHNSFLAIIFTATANETVANQIVCKWENFTHFVRSFFIHFICFAWVPSLSLAKRQFHSCCCCFFIILHFHVGFVAFSLFFVVVVAMFLLCLCALIVYNVVCVVSGNAKVMFQSLV